MAVILYYYTIHSRAKVRGGDYSDSFIFPIGDEIKVPKLLKNNKNKGINK